MISLAACLLLLVASPLDRKFDLIEQNRLKPGSRIAMPRSEWTAWMQQEAPPGVTRTRVDFGSNRVTAYANVDFLKLSRVAPNWFLSALLEGNRPVIVTARVQSGAGRARIDVERVEIAGAAVEGKALDFLIQEYVLRTYPDARVNRWFPLPNRMERLDIDPSGVTVIIGR